VKGKGISASDVAKRADMDRRCDGCGAGGESGTDEEARRHGAPTTRAAGGSASLGLVAGAGGGTSPAGSCCCLGMGMPGCTSHLNGTVPGLLNDSSNAMVWSLLSRLFLLW
jgi:hypothetical protein